MEEIAFTYEDLVIGTDELLTSLISKENLKEIINVVNSKIKYLTKYTLVFLQKIDDVWYVN